MEKMSNTVDLNSNENKFAVRAMVMDFSPTEQILGEEARVIHSGHVVSRIGRTSFDTVGSDFPSNGQKLNLKSWSKGGKSYKKKFVDHLIQASADQVVGCFTYSVDEPEILKSGLEAYQSKFGPMPSTSSYNKKGRERVAFTGRSEDGVEIPVLEVLKDDLCVLGWIASIIASTHKQMQNLENEKILLHVLIDSLPNEQGGDKKYKAQILNAILQKITDQKARIAGVRDVSMQTQRDFFVDNVAGLAREMFEDPNSTASRYAEKQKDHSTLFAWEIQRFSDPLLYIQRFRKMGLLS